MLGVLGTQAAGIPLRTLKEMESRKITRYKCTDEIGLIVSCKQFVVREHGADLVLLQHSGHRPTEVVQATALAAQLAFSTVQRAIMMIMIIFFRQ